MRVQAGFTLIESIVAVTVVAVLIAVVVVVSGPRLGQESSRGTVYELQSLVQLARGEAVARNREARVLLCPEQRQVLVTDTLGTAAAGDDVVLHRARIGESVSFASPEGGPAVGWAALGGSPEWFGVRFASDGTVEAGEGDVVVRGGARYGKLSLFAAGGMRVSTWSRGAWRTKRF